MTLPPIARNGLVTTPWSKMNRLYAEASRRNCELCSAAALAGKINRSEGLIAQNFGHAQERLGKVVGVKLLGLIVGAFQGAGIPCEIDWFYLDYADFAAMVGGQDNQSSASPQYSPDWELREGTVQGDLVELRLHPPRPANEPADSYYVDATLLFGTARIDVEPEDDREDTRTVSIALREARLAVGSDSYRPLHGTMLGEAGRQSAHFKRVSGGLDIVGPAPNGVLDGDPIGDQHLAVIAGTNAGDDEFAVGVAALRGSFVVGVVEPGSNSGATAPASVNRNAILNELIYSRARQVVGGTGRDDANRVVLARATVKRRREDLGPA